MEKISEAVCWFSEKVNKINKTLTTFIDQEKENSSYQNQE